MLRVPGLWPRLKQALLPEADVVLTGTEHIPSRQKLNYSHRLNYLLIVLAMFLPRKTSLEHITPA